MGIAASSGGSEGVNPADRQYAGMGFGCMFENGHPVRCLRLQLSLDSSREVGVQPRFFWKKVRFF